MKQYLKTFICIFFVLSTIYTCIGGAIMLMFFHDFLADPYGYLGGEMLVFASSMLVALVM